MKTSIASLLLIATLTACGGSSNGGTDVLPATSEPEPTEPEPTEPEPTEPEPTEPEPTEPEPTEPEPTEPEPTEPDQNDAAIDFDDVDPATLPLTLEPIPPVALIPDDVDLSVNQPPFFEDLTDIVVYAGQHLDLVMAPKDNDGTVPGVFTTTLPTNAKDVDNRNGTRSIRWHPLQPDVGVYVITITAQDALEPRLQTAQTIRIQVVLPDDLSTIPNYPPAINEIKDHTVRAGDTIVMMVKAVDPNGTYGPIEMVNPFPGSTFVPSDEEPDIYFYRWTSQLGDLGRKEFRFRATDAIDPNQTTERSFFVDIRDQDDFIVPGQRLRDLADARDFKIGYASFLSWVNRPDGELYGDFAKQEFNMLTPENSMKWGYVHPEPDEWRWEDADRTVQFAKDNDMLIHGHTLVWYAQVPQWVGKLNFRQRKTEMLSFIRNVVSRYNNDVGVWDVVNEALADDGSFRENIWLEAMGESYIDQAFRQARVYAPDASLLYNEYDVAWEGPKSDGMYSLLTNLLARGVPVDGVGFQMHVYAAFDQYESMRRNFQRFADLGLDIYITEFDVRMIDGDTLEQQANVYRNVLSICLEQPACKGFQTWGFTDRYTWLGEASSPLLFDRNYQAKPSYFALQQRLQE